MEIEPHINMRDKAQVFEDYLRSGTFSTLIPQGLEHLSLAESIHYSLQAGGKRFRPTLCLLVADALNVQAERVLPFALAIEMLHTYSLIHDDLPCMDNDDFRRGKPTNHKVFGEDVALLAGDALQALALQTMNKAYSSQPALALDLSNLTLEAVGTQGMITGQALDMYLENTGLPNYLEQHTSANSQNSSERAFQVIEKMHRLKTGALIRVCVEGVAVLAGVSSEERSLLRKVGEDIGLAFQVADDLLDANDANQDSRSFVGILGVSGTRSLLDQLSEKICQNLRCLKYETRNLVQLVQYNQTRKL